MSFQQLDSARSMRAEIEAAGLAAEEQCHISGELIQKLNELDLFSMTIPRAYGGAQLAHKLPREGLKKLVATVLILVGLMIIIRILMRLL